jgi:hypothetical protein
MKTEVIFKATNKNYGFQELVLNEKIQVIIRNQTKEKSAYRIIVEEIVDTSENLKVENERI